MKGASVDGKKGGRWVASSSSAWIIPWAQLTGVLVFVVQNVPLPSSFASMTPQFSSPTF